MEAPLKNLAIVFNGLYVGGAEKFGISLANKFVSEGTKVTLFFFQDIKSPLLEEIDQRIEKVYFIRKRKWQFNFSMAFQNSLEERSIKKVFIIGLMPLFFTRVKGWSRSKPIDYYLSLHSTIPKNIKTYLQNFLLLRLVRKSDRVLFICENQKKFYKDAYLFKPSHQSVIYNGVDTDYFKPDSEANNQELRRKLDIPEGHRVILLTATIRKEKGHSDAIAALKLLHEKFPGNKNTHLLFVGSGETSIIQSLKAQVKESDLENYVHFAGNQKDVRPFYSISDLFTLTSYSVETFSIAALEAMSMGLPLSLTEIGGASEMVTEGINGYLAKPKNPLSIATSWNKALNTQFDRNEIRETVIRKFSLDQMFAHYKTILS